MPPAAAADSGPPCPAITSLATESEIKIVGFQFTGTGQIFDRVGSDQKAVSKPTSVIGCYISEPFPSSPSDALWHVGVIDKDANGLYWKNGAGVTWRLTADLANARLETNSENPYYAFGRFFNLIGLAGATVTDCKLLSYTGELGAGFSKQNFSSFGKKSIAYRLLIPRFTDEPQPYDTNTTISGLRLDLVQKFFKESSYGKLDITFLLDNHSIRIKGRAADFDDGPNAGTSKTDTLMRLMYQEYLSRGDNEEFVGVIFAMPKELKNFHAGYAGSLYGITRNTSDSQKRIVWMGSAPFSWPGVTDPPWKVVAHELGHTLGLPDYYMTNTNEATRTNWSGMTIGPYDIMGSLSAKGNEFIFWNRWLLGWLPDEEVSCLTDTKEAKLDLEPINSRQSGIKGVVVRLSSSTALLLESRQGGGYDSTLDSDEKGVVVFLLNTKISSGSGPIRVIPRTNEYSNTPFSSSLQDKERFLKAPIAPGDAIIYEGIRIINIGTPGKDKVIVTTGADPRTVPALSVRTSEKYQVGVSVSLNPKSPSSGPFVVESLSPSVCEASALTISTRRAGTCSLRVWQQGSGLYFASQPLVVRFLIQDQITITCVKGKEIKKVTAEKPKCPRGFRKR